MTVATLGTWQPIWARPERLAMVRDRFAASEPTAVGMIEQARAVADQPWEAVVEPGEAAEGESRATAGGAYPVACAIMAMMCGEKAYADRALAHMQAWTTPWSRKNLHLGHQSLVAAIVQDGCYALWDDDQRQRHARLLRRLVLSSREVELHVTDPHVVTNNHWAVDHGGACMAAMALHGCDAGNGEPVDMSEQIAWARGRVSAFLMHHGDAGIYHEGLGYMAYAGAYWMPVVMASQADEGGDLLARHPQLRNVAASLYATSCARPTVSDSTRPADGFGMMLSWNDAGAGWLQSSVAVLSIAMAHDHQRGALRWMYDRLNGVAADSRFAPQWGGLFFGLLYYPYDSLAVEPAGPLPAHVSDSRQGLVVWRNRYRDADDAIFGAYARTTQIGGHKQDDAGSIRFMALGYDWIIGGGQARAGAIYQSVVTPVGGRTETNRCGAVMWDEPNKHGGVAGIDLRKPSVGYHERWMAVDYREAAGSPAVLAMLDQVDDHAGRDWAWHMSFDSRLKFEAHADGRGFTLQSPAGPNLTARFLGAQPDAVTLETMPDSQRKFQGGEHVTYPGRPYVRAAFAHRPWLGIYVVMAVQQGASPTIELIEGLDVQVGTWAWRRPFGAAIPAAFRLGKSGGLCKYPAGVVGYRAGMDAGPA